MLRRYGIHGLAGIGGISPIFGVSCPSAGGCTFELLARWDVANQGYANGQVLGIPEGVDVGQLTIVELDGTIAVVGNECAFTAQATPVFGDLGFYSQAIARTLGKALLATNLDLNFDNRRFAWGFNDAADGSTANAIYWTYWALGGALRQIWSVVWDGAGAAIEQKYIGRFLANTKYDYALVLGGYDTNEVPWDDTQAAANFQYGVSHFVKGGAYTDWTLLWRSVLMDTATLYAMLSNWNNVGEIDDFRVPEQDYSAVLQPLVKDTFTDVNGTSLDAHTPNVGGGWVEDSGDWDIQGNQARQSITAVPGFKAASVDAGIADVFHRATITTAGASNSVAGISMRVADGANFWILYGIEGANEFRLSEINAGVQTVRDSLAVGIAQGATYEITGATEGTSLWGWHEGLTAFITFASVFNQSETAHGLGEYRDNVTYTGDNSYDNVHTQPYNGYTLLDECP